MLQETGPLLIAANHPNSFLDAIIVSTLFKSPVYSLARGDVFKNPVVNKILRSCNMLPIYRKSEGAGNLGMNYGTFEECQLLFKQNKIVLIFSEGGCTNEWKLRPLKKGTARLALNAWQHGIPLKVLPLGINYSSFKFYGKNVVLNFGEVISPNDFGTRTADGTSINQFNNQLNAQLTHLVFNVNKNDRAKLSSLFYVNQTLLKKTILIIPAITGFLINAPLYFIIHLIIKGPAVDHYDSIITGILFFIYPLYVLAITLTVLFATGSPYSLLLLVLMPFTAWSYLQLKRQIRK